MSRSLTNDLSLPSSKSTLTMQKPPEREECFSSTTSPFPQKVKRRCLTVSPTFKYNLGPIFYDTLSHPSHSIIPVRIGIATENGRNEQSHSAFVIKIGALLAVPPTSHIFLLTIKSNSGDINNKSNNNETGVDKEYLKIPMQTKISFGEAFRWRIQ